MQAIVAVKKDLSLFDFSMDTAVAWRLIQQATVNWNRSSFHHDRSGWFVRLPEIIRHGSTYKFRRCSVSTLSTCEVVFVNQFFDKEIQKKKTEIQCLSFLMGLNFNGWNLWWFFSSQITLRVVGTLMAVHDCVGIPWTPYPPGPAGSFFGHWKMWGLRLYIFNSLS